MLAGTKLGSWLFALMVIDLSHGVLFYWKLCCDDKLFDEFHSLKQPLEVMLGDGYVVEATGRGTVVLELGTESGKASRCKLHEVLYVPDLSHNLLSVSKAAKAGKVVKFTETGCEVMDSNEVIAVATKVGNLYRVKRQADNEQANAGGCKVKKVSTFRLWY